ncbi:hypothetical protein [Flavobacterium proteolyticum]|uniref:Uncharacterized protein n=1 Tax=Flavobacterium proteolyticum TaxID=2911683 RepID=A0ABR9WTY7_9FLAO|nr:hypothetical protein [Flavobacterium proteolyticum]MBE9577113.1 hypothetical protein [Flavobacterium proteolyticum]
MKKRLITHEGEFEICYAKDLEVIDFYSSNYSSEPISINFISNSTKLNEDNCFQLLKKWRPIIENEISMIVENNKEFYSQFSQVKICDKLGFTLTRNIQNRERIFVSEFDLKLECSFQN